MSDPHAPTPAALDDEPKTPMWLPALGAALFVCAGLYWAVSPSSAPAAPTEAAASASAAPPAAAPPALPQRPGLPMPTPPPGFQPPPAPPGPPGAQMLPPGAPGNPVRAAPTPPAGAPAARWRVRAMGLLRVGVVGASGTSGAVATRLVAAHPRLALAFATSDRHVGEPVAARLGIVSGGDTAFVPNASALEHAGACDAVLLATSADVSARVAPAFAAAGKQVVDLSGAFRLAAADYPRWYEFEHPAPALLETAHYGLPELFGPPPAGALVSNPGCYPTAALLALAPLLREGLIEPGGIVVDAKSGVTGAGRQTGEAYSFLEIDGDVRAYKVLAHQHTPEIARALSRYAPGVRVTFTAHLLPIPRGLLATGYARPRPGATAARVKECLAEAYARTPFVRAVGVEDVMIKRVVGTNLALVGATADDDVVVAVGAVDNLLKGAAGQAVQNLNATNGWSEALGLEGLQRASA